jgi:hypothetical protein
LADSKVLSQHVLAIGSKKVAARIFKRFYMSEDVSPLYTQTSGDKVSKKTLVFALSASIVTGSIGAFLLTTAHGNPLPLTISLSDFALAGFLFRKQIHYVRIERHHNNG